MSPHPRVGREHILDTAENLFTEHGYKSASIREIARACGVTNAAIYYHFPDKESLFTEVMQRHAERLRDCMTRAGEAAESPREKVIAILGAYIDAIAGQHAPIFMLRKEAHQLKKRNMHRGRLMGTISQPLVETLHLAQQTSQIRDVPSAAESAAIFLGMLHGLAQQRRASGVEGRAISEEDIRMVVDLFWEGMEK